MNNLNIDQIPTNFKMLQTKCSPVLFLGVAKPNEFQSLLGFVADASMYHMEDAYLIRMEASSTQKSHRSYHLIGCVEGEYRSSSAISDLDIMTRQVRTQSGNIYSYENLHQSDPDHLVVELCGTLTAWGLADAIGIPAVYF